MAYLSVATMSPWEEHGDSCEFECIGCPYIKGVELTDDHQVEILCDCKD